MSDKEENLFGGFDEVFAQLATPDAVRETSNVSKLNLSSDEAGSLAEEIDPEELERRANAKPTKVEPVVAEEVIEEDEEEDDEEIDVPIEPTIEEEEEDETEEISEVDDEISDAEIVSPFFDLFSEELGWEVEDEDKPKDIKQLVDLMSGIIDSNSKPIYADDEIAKMDEFVKNGGNLNEYYQRTIAGVNVETVDLDKESNQKAVVTEFLKSTTGLSDTRIEKRVNRYDESGTLEEEAEEALDMLKEHKVKVQEKLLKDQKNAKKVQLQEQQNFVSNVQSEIEGMNSINGLQLSSKDKKDLVNYLFKVNAEGKTAYQDDYQKSIKNLIVSAYFVKEGDKVFSKVKKTADNDAIKTLKKRIKNKKSSNRNQKPYTGGNSNDIFDALDAASKVLSK
jgi:hypothetical protein